MKVLNFSRMVFVFSMMLGITVTWLGASAQIMSDNVIIGGGIGEGCACETQDPINCGHLVDEMCHNTVMQCQYGDNNNKICNTGTGYPCQDPQNYCNRRTQHPETCDQPQAH